MKNESACRQSRAAWVPFGRDRHCRWPCTCGGGRSCVKRRRIQAEAASSSSSNEDGWFSRHTTSDCNVAILETQLYEH
jgi:hypothetical protein